MIEEFMIAVKYRESQKAMQDKLASTMNELLEGLKPPKFMEGTPWYTPCRSYFWASGLTELELAGVTEMDISSGKPHKEWCRRHFALHYSRQWEEILENLFGTNRPTDEQIVAHPIFRDGNGKYSWDLYKKFEEEKFEEWWATQN